MDIAKPIGRNLIHQILIFFILINAIGDLGNIAVWYSTPESRVSLENGYIASLVGTNDALIAGSIILAVVAAVYFASLFGLFRKQKWGPLLVIAISVPNRIIATFLYEFSNAFMLWAAWTVVLIVLAYLDFRKLSTASQISTEITVAVEKKP